MKKLLHCKNLPNVRFPMWTIPPSKIVQLFTKTFFMFIHSRLNNEVQCKEDLSSFKTMTWHYNLPFMTDYTVSEAGCVSALEHLCGLARDQHLKVNIKALRRNDLPLILKYFPKVHCSLWLGGDIQKWTSKVQLTGWREGPRANYTLSQDSVNLPRRFRYDV